MQSVSQMKIQSLFIETFKGEIIGVLLNHHVKLCSRHLQGDISTIISDRTHHQFIHLLLLLLFKDFAN